MATITIIDTASGDTLETYENVQPDDYNLAAKSLRLPAGRGVTTIQFGADVIMREDTGEDAPEVEDPSAERIRFLEAETEDADTAFDILTGGADYE